MSELQRTITDPPRQKDPHKSNDECIVDHDDSIRVERTATLNHEDETVSSSFDIIPHEIIVDHIFAFVGVGHHRFVAGTNKTFSGLYAHFTDYQYQQQPETNARNIANYSTTEGVTTFANAVESVSRAELFWNETSDANMSFKLPVYSRPIIGNKRTKITITCIGIMAARYGRLEVLKWAIQNGCAWNCAICQEAAAHGHLKVLQWARENKSPWDYRTCSAAAGNGHLELLRWSRENGCGWGSDTCRDAAKGGHLKVLQWAHQNGCSLSSEICLQAAKYGHLVVLKWAREKGCPWDSYTCASAAGMGELAVLKWAHENGCAWDSDTCRYAAQGGHLEVLQWARENGCEWDYQTCSLAAKYGNLDILKWARKNGCEWDAWMCAFVAQQSGHFEVLQWVRANKRNS